MSFSNSARQAAPIFVVAYMRSGTTLMQNVLTSHPDVYGCRGETKYFEFKRSFVSLYPNYREDDEHLAGLITTLADVLSNGYAKLPHNGVVGYHPADFELPQADLNRLVKQAHTDLTYGGILRIVFEYMAEQVHKRRWLEKTPQHVYYVDDILREIPDALFVGILRDPRDVLASKKYFKASILASTNMSTAQQREQSLKRSFDPFWDSLAWNMATNALHAAQNRHPEHILIVRYEDFVTEPEKYVRQICAFLSLPYHDELIDLENIHRKQGKKPPRNKTITPKLIGRWRERLTPAETLIIQRLTRKHMISHAYERTPIAPHHALPAAGLLIRSAGELLRRLFNRWRVGGWRYMLNSVDNYYRQAKKLIFKSTHIL